MSNRVAQPTAAAPAAATLKVNDPLGLRPSLENTRLCDLQVDATYQRSIDNESSKALIRRIAMYWDWGLYHPLSVSRRPDGSMWVVDGQHRLAAARLRGDMFDLPCVVTSYHSTSDEAASFVAMNIQRRALSALDLFRAALAASDDNAGEIDVMIRAADLRLAKHSNFTAWRPGEISNIGGIKACHRKYGREVTATALVALSRAFQGQVLRYGGTIFSALGEFMGRAAYGASLDLDLLVSILSALPQQEWVVQIEQRRAQLGMQRGVAGAQVFAEAYREVIEHGDDDQDQPAVPATAITSQKGLVQAITSQKGLAHLVTCTEPATLERIASASLASSAAPALPAAPVSSAKAPASAVVKQSLTTGKTSRPAAPAASSAPKAPQPEGKPNTVRQQRPTVPLRLSPQLNKGRSPMPAAGTKAWCEQCDKMRFASEIQRCADKFCRFDKGTK